MSDPSDRSRRRLPARLQAGSTVSGLVGTALFLTPVFVLLQQIAVSAPGTRTVVGIELLVAMFAVVAMNAVFVSGETAIELVRTAHLRQASTDDKRTRILQDILARKQLLVAACFLGSQTMRAWLVLLSVPLAMSLSPRIAEWYRVQDGWPSVLLAGFVICIPVVAINVVFGELVPRSYASSDPAKAACRCYGLVNVFAFLFKPFAITFMSVGSLLTKRFGARASFSIGNLAEEEIKERLEQAVETQEIEEEEQAMLHSVFEFGDTVSREIMTPRVDMDAVPITASLSEVADLVEESGHSRIPVYEGTDVHAKDVLSTMKKGREAMTLRAILRPAVFVPENKSLHDLLQEMRQAKTQMVIVQDEFGGTAGVVTIEDIVEEVVGEIVDEYDEEELPIVKHDHGFSIQGKTHIDDVNTEIGTSFESEEFDTLGGFVFGLFGRQPNKGESIDADGYRFTVSETDGRRIVSVELERIEDQEGLEIFDRITEGAS
jgi:putative hemolysin